MAEERETEEVVQEQPAAEEAVTLEEDALAKAQAEAEDFKRKWYSVTAEYENYRKRTALTRSQAYAEGRADIASKLFPIADNLYRAIGLIEDEKSKQGVDMIIKSFEKLLEEEKITAIDPLGEPFDVEKCEAIMAIEPQEGEESGIVKQVYLKGYEQNGKVLRFAQVVVTK